MVKRLNERAKKLTFFDIGLVKWAVFFATIIIVKLFPQILNIHFFILIALVIICSARPFYRFWIKK